MKGLIKRRVQIDANLYFEYDVSPHRAILALASELSAKVLAGLVSSSKQPRETGMQVSEHAVSASRPTAPTGMHIPFKQVRLKGEVNPLKPPLHVETVLIGRALGQKTGYLLGVGFRVRDDGYVEGEFLEGAEKFTSFGKFQEEVSCRLSVGGACSELFDRRGE
ncbi:hypothetical protein [Bradyrhizobium sp. RDM4]|uniref:hypothetical protein n=1 Tax=Bradyrhizobium sp. RDM4 TaxID=3378765 RepID=UPI0038FC300F